MSAATRNKGFTGVYDKAKWHYEGDFPKELEQYHGFIHIGYYLTWLVDNNLFDHHNNLIAITEIQKIKNRTIKGTQFLKEFLDGVLIDEDLTAIGNEFSYYYYEKGTYFDDYFEVLCEDLPTIYHIQDSWENYNKIKPIIDKRYNDWKQLKNKKWWQFFK